MKKVTIYTDGACLGNPGPGGWGVILNYKGVEKSFSGAEPDTTNNRMELTAAIEALAALTEACDVTLYTDSAYLCNAFNKGWLNIWLENGWKTTSKKPVENQDLWEELSFLASEHRVTWEKVKGHSDNECNNRCDKLAREAIKSAAADDPG